MQTAFLTSAAKLASIKSIVAALFWAAVLLCSLSLTALSATANAPVPPQTPVPPQAPNPYPVQKSAPVTVCDRNGCRIVQSSVPVGDFIYNPDAAPQQGPSCSGKATAAATRTPFRPLKNFFARHRGGCGN